MLALRRMLTPRRKRVMPPSITDEIVTERLLIRPTRPGDSADVLTSIDDEIETINGWRPQSKLDLGRAIAADRDPWHWVIRLREPDVLIGVLGAQFVDPLMIDGCEIGFWVLGQHRRNGYMTEAVAAFVERLGVNDITTVRASTAVSNVAVHRIMHSVGFVETGRRQRTLQNGTVIDAIDYKAPACQ